MSFFAYFANNWDESEHPRADDGKFGKGGSGGKKSEKKSKGGEHAAKVVMKREHKPKKKDVESRAIQGDYLVVTGGVHKGETVRFSSWSGKKGEALVFPEGTKQPVKVKFEDLEFEPKGTRPPDYEKGSRGWVRYRR